MKVNSGGDFEVAVIGGGPAGIMAGIASARTGAKTVLIERNGYLGGEAATGLPILVFYDQSGDLIIKGLPQEFVSNLQEFDGSPGHIFGETGHTHCLTPLYPDVVKVVAALVYPVPMQLQVPEYAG